jgi:hypothetical protein
MPATSESALSLAGRLRSLPDTELAALLGAREIRESGIRDFFDLAEALLDPTSVQHALGRLDRSTLLTLSRLSSLGPISPADATAHAAGMGVAAEEFEAHLAETVRLALVTLEADVLVVPSSVTERLAEWPLEGLPSLEELASTSAPAALAAVSSVDTRFVDRLAAERAFATTTSIGELLAALDEESARELARGGIALPDTKRLAGAMGVDLDRVPGLVEIAARAGLVALDSGRWMPTVASSEWMVGSSGHRWSALAGAWLDRLPSDIRAILASRAHATWGDGLDEFVNWLYPAGGEWMRDRVQVYTRDAELLGITADQVPSTPGVALLVHGASAATAPMTSLFPAEVEQVYLQHDLSIVSPGPLAPRVDARLRGMADVEGRALASTYRVSTASLYRALAEGETAESIREFFAEIALTGIPQPLEYLLAEAAARYGLVRVGAMHDGSSHTYVSSTDATLLRTLLVDHSISSLGLMRMGDRLATRFDLELVYFTLSAARYPVAAENASGEIVLLSRRRPAAASTPAAGTTAISLIEKLRLGSSSDPDVTGKAWLSRQLDVAIKAKVALTVTVELADGSLVDYQLEPTSVAGGRLRARDRRADIERTLPLSRITAVGPAR